MQFRAGLQVRSCHSGLQPVQPRGTKCCSSPCPCSPPPAICCPLAKRPALTCLAAGAITATVVCPLDVLKTRLQVQGKAGAAMYKGVGGELLLMRLRPTHPTPPTPPHAAASAAARAAARQLAGQGPALHGNTAAAQFSYEAVAAGERPAATPPNATRPLSRSPALPRSGRLAGWWLAGWDPMQAPYGRAVAVAATGRLARQQGTHLPLLACCASRAVAPLQAGQLVCLHRPPPAASHLRHPASRPSTGPSATAPLPSLPSIA